MTISAEISLYPLRETHDADVLQFIEKIQSHPGITVETNAMSTLMTGDYDEIMNLIHEEVRHIFTRQKAVLIVKISNGCLVNE